MPGVPVRIAGYALDSQYPAMNRQRVTQLDDADQTGHSRNSIHDGHRLGKEDAGNLAV